MNRTLCTLVGTIPLIAAPDASAQETIPARGLRAGNEEMQEIVVTARRREEFLQDVPISVTAISEEALRDQNVRDITDISAPRSPLPCRRRCEISCLSRSVANAPRSRRS